MYGRTGSATFATGYRPLLELLVIDLQYLDIAIMPLIALFMLMP